MQSPTPLYLCAWSPYMFVLITSIGWFAVAEMIPVNTPEIKSLNTPFPKIEDPADWKPRKRGNLIACELDSFAIFGIVPQVNPLHPNSLLTYLKASNKLLYFGFGITLSWMTLIFMFSNGIWTNASKKPAVKPANILLATVSYPNCFITVSKTPNLT